MVLRHHSVLEAHVISEYREAIPIEYLDVILEDLMGMLEVLDSSVILVEPH